jgi:hypothetical protein
MAAFHFGLALMTLWLGRIELRVRIYKTVIDVVTTHRLENGTLFRVTEGTTVVPPGVHLSDATALRWDLIPSYRHAGHLPFTVLTATFFLLSCVFHLGNATVWWRWYTYELARCRTPSRWIEYFFSAPVMIVLVGYSLGLRDRVDLLAVAVLVAVTMPFGAWTEQIARPATLGRWRRTLLYRIAPWMLGHVPQTAAWGIIVWQFYDSTASTTGSMPWFVYVILWGELALFFSFGFAALWSQWRAPRYFYQGELLFQFLSLTSKGLLGGILLANVLMLSDFDEIYD